MSKIADIVRELDITAYDTLFARVLRAENVVECSVTCQC